MSILAKLHARAQAAQSWLCVGLDAEPDKLPAPFSPDADGLLAFNRWLIDQTAPYACAFKPNVAFYEALGTAGHETLRQTVAHLRAHYPDIVTVCDAKRGDIGNTSAAYARAIFDELGFDAVTLSPYLGKEALAPFLNRADRLSFILCRTSNPGAGELQDLRVGDKALWQVVAEKVAAEWNALGNCGLVVGATYPAELAQVCAVAPQLPLLVPGIGAQGGDLEAVRQAAGAQTLLVNVGRAIFNAADPASAARNYQQALIPSA